VRKIGEVAERRGAEFLMERGFQILETNFYAKVGEIDIVALKDGVLHFVEVKFSQRHDPYERITPAKLKKLYRTIDHYLRKHPSDLPYQLDGLFIKGEDFVFVENISL